MPESSSSYDGHKPSGPEWSVADEPHEGQLYREGLYLFRHEVVSKFQQYEALSTAGKGWMLFEWTYAPADTQEDQPFSPTAKIVYLNLQFRQAGPQPDAMFPRIRILTNEFYPSPEGFQILCEDYTFDEHAGAAMLPSMVDLDYDHRPKVLRTEEDGRSVTSFSYTHAVGIRPNGANPPDFVNLHPATPMSKIQLHGQPDVSFVTNCWTHRRYALERAQEVLAEVQPLEPAASSA